MRPPNKFIIIINSTVISIIIDFFHSYIEKNRKTLLVSENSRYAEAFLSELRQNGAHIVGDLLYASASGSDLENWVCAVSPNL